MTEKIRVGIIDDDKTKITQILTNVRSQVNGASKEVIEQYSEYELIPIELTIQSDLDAILDDIDEKKINALMIDYQLTSYEPHVKYTGVTIAERTEQKYLGFPTFILTSFESDLFKHEVFDAYKVFDFERYMNDEQERIELNKKIIEQYIKRKKEIEKKRNEFNELEKLKGSNQEVDDRLIELDDFLERSINGDNAISKNKKKEILDKRFDEILKLLHKVVKEQ